MHLIYHFWFPLSSRGPRARYTSLNLLHFCTVQQGERFSKHNFLHFFWQFGQILWHHLKHLIFWMSVEQGNCARWPHFKVNVIITKHTPHSSKHLLLHLCAWEHPFAISSHSFSHLYWKIKPFVESCANDDLVKKMILTSRWSGSNVSWHFCTHAWPHSKRSSHG